LPRKELICKECRKKLPLITGPRCLKCGRRVSEGTEYCSDCQRRNHLYERGFALWEYDDTMKASIASFKYKGRAEYAGFYAGELADKFYDDLKRVGIEAVIPVPVHSARKAVRGYNQAELVATKVAELLEVPCITDLLKRGINTAPQKDLSPSERFQNLREAFVINKKSNAYEHYWDKVVLVDDIYTTGSTVDACTERLLAAGVGHVYHLCLCIGKDS